MTTTEWEPFLYSRFDTRGMVLIRAMPDGEFEVIDQAHELMGSRVCPTFDSAKTFAESLLVDLGKVHEHRHQIAIIRELWDPSGTWRREFKRQEIADASER